MENYIDEDGNKRQETVKIQGGRASVVTPAVQKVSSSLTLMTYFSIIALLIVHAVANRWAHLGLWI